MNIFTKLWNSFNIAVLKSPLHFMTSKHTMLITVTGRKSGKQITTPVNYAQDGSIVRLTSQPDRQWWRNLKTNPEVIVHLRGKAMNGTTEVFAGGEAAAQELEAYLSAFPQYAKYFNISVKDDKTFNQADLLKAAEERVMIKIKVNT